MATGYFFGSQNFFRFYEVVFRPETCIMATIPLTAATMELTLTTWCYRRCNYHDTGAIGDASIIILLNSIGSFSYMCSSAFSTHALTSKMLLLCCAQTTGSRESDM